jgi:hypothetical protein
LEPFCKKQDRKSEPAFYLEEDRHKKKSWNYILEWLGTLVMLKQQENT